MKPFEQYIRMLLELHILMSSGKGDSKEAELIRDQMQMPWYQLSDYEMKITDLVSEALYGDNKSHTYLTNWLERLSSPGPRKA